MAGGCALSDASLSSLAAITRLRAVDLQRTGQWRLGINVDDGANEGLTVRQKPATTVWIHLRASGTALERADVRIH